MIQRIQTLYLVIAVVLMGFFLGLPLSRFLADDKEIILTVFSISEAATGIKIINTWPLTLLGVASTALPAAIIFLFKRRQAQIRLCYAEIVLLIGLQILTLWYILHTQDSLKGYDTHSAVYSIPAIFPLLSMIFVWLALRGITRDELLVRSLDRLR